MKRSILTLLLLASPFLAPAHAQTTDPAELFANPPATARPGVLWMWMGSNISKEGITRDLEALKATGFNRTTMFHLSDITMSLSVEIANRPGPEIISWTEPWWDMVRFAALESKRLGMEFGIHNCPGYETSGGPWITAELSMQDIVWSQQTTTGGKKLSLMVQRPDVDPTSTNWIPYVDRTTGARETPRIPERKTYYRDVAVVAVPATGNATRENVVDLTDRMGPDGSLNWDAPAGAWTIYRFGHTTTGSRIFPAQWQATGFECDKMSAEAVTFHCDHVIGEITKHVGDLIGTGFSAVHFDSYEAGMPTWTPRMPQEFKLRRGYDITPCLPILAGRKIGTTDDSLQFRKDLDQTIKDLYRDNYFAIVSRKLAAAGLTYLAEPYGGPWDPIEVMPYVHRVMTEYWTTGGIFTPFELEPTVIALRKAGKNIVEAEAMTGQPMFSRWTETPAWLKPVGDGAFCAGVNRFVLHRFVHQPWDDRYRPGATFGHWGTHFDRTQTWWGPFQAMVTYWQRCQALLQWGSYADPAQDLTLADSTGTIRIGHCHRTGPGTEIYFLANTAHTIGSARCTFRVTGKVPELWDPVTGAKRTLPEFRDDGKRTSIPLRFNDAESYFIVFRDNALSHESCGTRNFPEQEELFALTGPWRVTFDPAWGGPSQPVTFTTLTDWTTRAEPGVRYYSGTAVYRTTFDAPRGTSADRTIDLGIVRHVARVRLNSKDLGVVWTAPWRVHIPHALLLRRGNTLEIEVTNVWANRLIGDEQEPPDATWDVSWTAPECGWFMTSFPDWFVKHQQRPSAGRYCFTPWNYFTKDDPLVPSGLLGPVTLLEVSPDARSQAPVPGPFNAAPWLSSVSTGKRISLRLHSAPMGGLHLPVIPHRKIVSARIKDGASLRVRTENGQLIIPLPPGPVDEGTTIVLTLDGSAGGLPPLAVPHHELRNAVRLTNPPSPTYEARGVGLLSDGQRARAHPADDRWLGFERENCEAIIDLHDVRPVSSVVVGCLQAPASAVFFPRSIEVSVSVDGSLFTRAGTIQIGDPVNDGLISRRDLSVTVARSNARYVKVRATNIGECPAWHRYPGTSAWLFVDEIGVER